MPQPSAGNSRLPGGSPLGEEVGEMIAKKSNEPSPEAAI